MYLSFLNAKWLAMVHYHTHSICRHNYTVAVVFVRLEAVTRVPIVRIIRIIIICIHVHSLTGQPHKTNMYTYNNYTVLDALGSKRIILLRSRSDGFASFFITLIKHLLKFLMETIFFHSEGGAACYHSLIECGMSTLAVT